MKLTTPIKSIYDITDTDDISCMYVVSMSVDLHICITQLKTKGPITKHCHKGEYSGSIRVSELSKFNHKLKNIECEHFLDLAIPCNFAKTVYVCEDLIMAARLIHAAMEDIQKVCEVFDIDPRTNESVGAIIADCFDHVVLTADQPGGLISQYKKDLRRGTPVKLPDNYFDVFPIGF